MGNIYSRNNLVTFLLPFWLPGARIEFFYAKAGFF